MQRNMQDFNVRRFNDSTYSPSSMIGSLMSIFNHPRPHQHAATALSILKKVKHPNAPQQFYVDHVKTIQQYFNDFSDDLNIFTQGDKYSHHYQSGLGINFTSLLSTYANDDYSLPLLLPILLDVISKHTDAKAFLNEFIVKLCQVFVKSPSEQRLLAFITAINHPIFNPHETFCDTLTFHPKNEDERLNASKIDIDLFTCLYMECKKDNPLLKNMSVLITELYKMEKFDKNGAIIGAIMMHVKAKDTYVPIKAIVNPVTYPDFLSLERDPALYLSVLCKDIFLIIGAYSFPLLQKMPVQAPSDSEKAASIIHESIDNESSEIKNAADIRYVR